MRIKLRNYACRLPFSRPHPGLIQDDIVGAGTGSRPYGCLVGQRWDGWYANRANTRFAPTVVGWEALGWVVGEQGGHIGPPLHRCF